MFKLFSKIKRVISNCFTAVENFVKSLFGFKAPAIKLGEGFVLTESERTQVEASRNLLSHALIMACTVDGVTVTAANVEAFEALSPEALSNVECTLGHAVRAVPKRRKPILQSIVDALTVK